MALRKRKPFDALTAEEVREASRKRIVACPRCLAKLPLSDMAGHFGSKACLARKRRIQKNKSDSIEIASEQKVWFVSGGLPETNRRKH
jgi:hypothetical protein